MRQTKLQQLQDFKKNAPGYVDRKDVSLNLDGNIIRVECEFINGTRLVHEVHPSVFLDALKELNLQLHKIKRSNVRNQKI